MTFPHPKKWNGNHLKHENVPFDCCQKQMNHWNQYVSKFNCNNRREENYGHHCHHNCSCKCNNCQQSNCRGQCPCQCNSFGDEGPIIIQVFGFSAGGFTYTTSRNGALVNAAVSFTVSGVSTIPTPPYFAPRSIGGSIDKDGNILGGTGDFTVSHPSVGVYLVTFNPPFSLIMEDQPPKVRPLPINSNVVTSNQLADGYIVKNFYGVIDPNGNILMDQSSSGFKVIHDNNLKNGVYKVIFDQPVVYAGPPNPLEVVVLTSNSVSCCPCCGDSHHVGQGIITEEGVDLIGVDATGFSYKTWVIEGGVKKYRDLAADGVHFFIQTLVNP